MNREKTRLLTKIGKNWLAGLVMAASVLVVSQAARAEVTVTATVDRNALNPEDTLTLTISVDSSEDVAFGQPTLPPSNDFEILNEWDVATAASDDGLDSAGPAIQTGL